jgi:hypothetical protein
MLKSLMGFFRVIPISYFSDSESRWCLCAVAWVDWRKKQSVSIAQGGALQHVGDARDTHVTQKKKWAPKTWKVRFGREREREYFHSLKWLSSHSFDAIAYATLRFYCKRILLQENSIDCWFYQWWAKWGFQDVQY